MTSYLSDDFITLFRKLPHRVQKAARKNYRLWKQDPQHPSLAFKCLSRKDNVYSVRVGIGWRALGYVEKRNIYWFWIGSHPEYERILTKL